MRVGVTPCLTISGAQVEVLIVAFVLIGYSGKVIKWLSRIPKRNFLMMQNRVGGYFTPKREGY